MAGRKAIRILFVGEAASLAHVARPLALAAALPSEGYEITFACPEAHRGWVAEAYDFRPLTTLSPSRFAGRAATGRPLFDRALLEAYARDDIALIGEVRPDVVVGDGRLSLAASARTAGVGYLAVTNAFWHPGRPLPGTVPCLRWTGPIPEPVLNALWPVLSGPAMAWNIRPVAQLLEAHGVRGPGRDLRRVGTDSDFTLYADIPDLFPDVVETDRRRFLGPILWEPPVARPKWWGSVPQDRPIAYVTPGSSGNARVLPLVVETLKGLGFTVLAATAGRVAVETDGTQVFAAKFLPGSAASARADLVVCNGGSLTTTQALMAGRPVLGICTNLDQFLNMAAVAAAGAGTALRSDRLERSAISAAVRRLQGSAPREAARAIGAPAAAIDIGKTLDGAIRRVLSGADRRDGLPKAAALS